MTATPPARDGARLARDGAVNYGGALAAALVGLALVPLLLDRLGAERYGVLLIALTCANLVTFIDVGLGSALTREVALAGADRVRFVRSAGIGFVVVGLAGAALMACAGALAGALGLGSAGAHTLLVFALVGVGFAGDQLTVFHTAVLGGLRRFGTVNALLVGSVGVRAAGIVVVLSAGGGVVAVAAWYAVSAWVWAAINALWLHRLSPELSLRPVAPDRAVLGARLGFGAGSLVIMFALTSLWSAGPLLVAGVEGAAASALFAVSQRFALALQAVPERVSATLFPAAGPADLEQARWLVASGTRLVLAILAPLAAILLVAPGDVLHAWLGELPSHGEAILRATAVAVVAYGLAASAIQVLWGRGHVRGLARDLGVVAVTGIVVSGLATVLVGPEGAAYALACTTVLVCACVLRLAARELGCAVGALLAPAGRSVGPPAIACAAVGGLLASGSGIGGSRAGAIGLCAVVLATYVLVLAAREGRRLLRRVPALRSAWYLLLHVRAAIADSGRRGRRDSLAAYAERPDPWGYETAWGSEHLALAERLLELACAGGSIPRAVDVGCGEGWTTRRLLSRCDDVLAVDISPLALERARERCDGAGHVRFERWDMLRDEPLGRFDLVLAMGVLELFRRPWTLRGVRDRLIEMVAPGGHLLVATTRQSPVVEGARWSRVLVIGCRQIDRALLATGELERCGREESETHLLTLYRRLPAAFGV
jgi:O-antigen/teichoic acid export membrane protein/SAM-dependent methyltransferase